MSTSDHSHRRHGDTDPVNRPSSSEVFAAVLERRLSRRGFLRGGLLAAGGLLLPGQRPAAGQADSPVYGFTELVHGRDADFHVAPGYRHQILLRWGDPLFPDAPAFDPAVQSGQTQHRQFGYNNDFLAFMPLPAGRGERRRGLLVANHEYTLRELMFPDPDSMERRARIDTEIAAHGMTVAAITRGEQGWRVDPADRRNRRVTPWTPMRFSGPAAGHPRLRHAGSPDGIRTAGTYGNCAGGTTPWGTVLSAEENVQYYFSGAAYATPEADSHRRMGIQGDATRRYDWGLEHPRWRLESTPNEPLHAGWIVELDPHDPGSTPVKRTALGRCRHEACTVSLNPDGRAVAYSGDDQVFEHIYRFVSRDRYREDDRRANRDLLDHGELSVAEFRDDGRLIWHPLVQGRGALTPDNGFHSQADVVIDMRRAADLLGATPMDRPEDIEVNPATGTVFAMLTKNKARTDPDPANPRAANPHGHILELTPPGGDHAAAEFGWDVLLLAGDPARADDGARYHPGISAHGSFAAPDNCAFDDAGRLWIATDGAGSIGIADGLWVCDVSGPRRALTRHFLRTPLGAELCGPCFTPDHDTLFVAVQHPGEGSDFAAPETRWPDFRAHLPPRPSVVAIEREGGGPLLD